MQYLNVDVNVIGLEDTLEVDVAGFTCLQDLQDYVEDSCTDAGIPLGGGWGVVTTSDMWVFQSGLDPEKWLWEWVEHLGQLNVPYGVDVCEAAWDLDIDVDSYEEAYQGHFCSDVDFAENLTQDFGLTADQHTWPNNHIDWDRAAMELMQEYEESNGHYFRIM